MATPVPVVSIMYFLVSTPPNIIGSARPAFLAMSVKCARGLFLGSWIAAKRIEKGKRRANEVQESLKRNREREVGPEIMNSWHTKVRVTQGDRKSTRLNSSH